ncbi:DUF1488 family protein [Pusillimonas sp.]|uniref:DUF1488 family protein n=1 Tax=Pusillimonas sp. TaxID=3040095 RepID=UPI0037CBDE85
MGEFAKMTGAKYQDGYIRFSWGDGVGKRKYEISGDALLQAFDAENGDPAELLDAFEKGRQHIIRAAEDARNTPTDGIIELGSGDFEPKNNRGGISPGESGGPG